VWRCEGVMWTDECCVSLVEPVSFSSQISISIENTIFVSYIRVSMYGNAIKIWLTISINWRDHYGSWVIPASYTLAHYSASGFPT
jgi:hypothetical protein